MNSPLNSCHSIRHLILTLLLFLGGMELSFGMDPLGGKQTCQLISKNVRHNDTLEHQEKLRNNSAVQQNDDFSDSENDENNENRQEDWNSTDSITPEKSNFTSIPSNSPIPSNSSMPRRLTLDRRLSGRIAFNLNSSETAKFNEQSSPYSTTTAATIPKSVKKAAQKWLSKMTSNYVASGELEKESRETRAQRTEISAKVSKIEVESKKKQQSLQQQFLKKQKSLIERRTAINFARNIPLASHRPETALSALRKNYSHEQSVTELAKQLALYPLANIFFNSYLLKRQAILPDNQKKGADEIQQDADEVLQLNRKAAEALQLVQRIGTNLIKNFVPHFQNQEGNEPSLDTLKNLTSLNEKQREYLHKTLNIVNNAQLFILRCHTSPYISASKNKLDEIETLFSKDALIKKQPISSAVKATYIECKNFFSSSKSIFSLKETISAKETIKAAQENASNIQEWLAKIENSKMNLNEVQKEVDDADSQKLEAEVKVMEQLESCFKDAMFAYLEIQDEAHIEKKCSSLHQLKEIILKDCDSLLANAQTLKIQEQVEPLLNELRSSLESSIFLLDEVHLLPQHPSVFLDNLENLTSNLGDQCVIGIHGKIVLDTFPQKIGGMYPDGAKREWLAGINTIREGLRRGWGIHVVQQFDEEFEPFIRNSIPIRVSKLKKFLSDVKQKMKCTGSFFIVSEMTREKFLNHLEQSKETLTQTSPTFSKIRADQVIKIDEATLAFNPFDQKPLPRPQETLAAAESRQRQAGFEYVREALESAFPEASLLPKQLNEILKEFDTQFKIDHAITEKPALTLTTAAQFINDQKEILRKRSFWKKNISPYLDRDVLIANALNGLSYTIGSHFGGYILLALPYFYILWLNHTHSSGSTTSPST